MKKITALTTLALLAMGTVPAQAAETISSYIVTAKTIAAAPAVKVALTSLGVAASAPLTNIEPSYTVNMTASAAATLAANPNVLMVKSNDQIELFDTQTPTPTWGLDRIDQASTTYDSSYTYPANGGANVRVYVVDTGVQATNTGFGGRVQVGFDALGNNAANADCNGHGTHVAGTIASSVYGVAKKATIVPVRVMNCTGKGTYSSILAGLDWIIANHPKGTPGVVNMSIGGGRYQVLDDAVVRLYRSGLSVFVAAGNNNGNACNYSPSATPEAVTVASSNKNDGRSSFSNYGDCVDTFAPGEGIISENAKTPGTALVMSGTSMAAPHVAGIAALYLGVNGNAGPGQVTAAILNGNAKGAISDAKSPYGNGIVNVGFVTGQTPPPAVVPAPTPVPAPVVAPAPVVTPSPGAPITISQRPTVFRTVTMSKTAMTFSWVAPAYNAAAPVTGYELLVSKDNGITWVSGGKISSALKMTTNLAPAVGQRYSYRIAALNAAGRGEPSATITVQFTK